MTLAGKDVEFEVDLDRPETILDSGYISSMMREIAELRDNQDLLNETDTMAKVCNELLMFRRPFYELSSSDTVINRFLTEFTSSKSKEVPKVSGRRYISDKERENEFNQNTVKYEAEVSSYSFSNFNKSD
jgi:hypothetical protein